ncbi:MAG: HAMP domain-containing histidine kinase [Lachnospiraceae bacterium]|nr:HAMP domain-containing histidine kinase [Lachnospiraceae bacterium]
MKLRTRLVIAFLIIMMVPCLMFGIIMLSFTRYRGALENNYGVTVTLDNITDSMQIISNSTQEIFDRLIEQADEDADVFLDTSYLDEMNEELVERYSYLIVRVDDTLYYVGATEDDNASLLFEDLPSFREAGEVSDVSTYVGEDTRAFIRQLDVAFEDGSEGSIFIISSAARIVKQTRKLLQDLLIAVAVILIFTSLIMVIWIYTGVNVPLKKLSEATHRIKEKDFDFEIEVKGNDEISMLCRDFDDMRRQLKMQEEEKESFDRQSKELISNISHDLKTPITAVKGYVEGIMDGVADTPEKMDRYIRTIYIKANDMDRLINELTFYSKIDTNRIPYNFKKIDAVEYFDDCAEEVGLEMHEREIRFSYINSVEPGTLVIADAEQLKRVVNNIIGNSIKYMDKPRKEVQLRVFNAGDFVQAEIEDNGKGIENKDLVNIFDRFYRTDMSRNSSQGGSGIGLSIVRKIIEDHGGRIWATSKVGEGTTMHFLIRKYAVGSSAQQ